MFILLAENSKVYTASVLKVFERIYVGTVEACIYLAA